MRYLIETRKKELMNYATAGDYYIIGNKLFVDICEQVDEDYEFLIMIHELIEEYLTRKRGILEPDITKFDKQFEEERESGLWNDEEPGMDPRAPYRKEHIFAENIERLLAQELGVDWVEYSQKIIS